MKHRWLLGLLVSLTACSKDDQQPPTGGSGGQVGNTGGSSTTTGGSVATGGSTATGGSITSNGGSASGNGGSAGSKSSTGGTSQGGSATGGGGATANGGSPPAGGSATGGQAQAGSTATGGSGGAPPGTGASVLERNGGPTREGTWTQPTLTQTAAAKMTLEAGFKATFKGNMYASPLYVENGPGGKGVFIAVSTDNVVAALDETTGATVWSKTLGASPGAAGQGCIQGDPVGILSTPVIDGKSGTIYVAAAIGTSSLERHEVHALSVEDGSSRSGWPVNVSALKAGSLSFNTKYQNQRSALSLANGIVYVAYGGFIGDCNDYHGWVVAIDAADASKTGAWATAGKGEAIWAAAGFASDGTNIFPVTGNNTGSAASRDASDSEAILKISGLAQYQRSDATQFYPAAWKSMDSADADLGGSNSMLIRIPGSTPEKVLVTIAKDGKMYLVDPANLGGSDGHVAVLEAASPSMPRGNGVKTAPTAYTTAKGTYIAFTVQSGANCPNNSVTGSSVMAVRLQPGSPPTADLAWCAAGPNPFTSAISTTSDGKADPIVWFVNGGQLRGLDGDTGEVVSQGSGTCSGIQRWTSPIAVKGRIVAGGNGALCSWKGQ
jgi:hypothetical protein